MGSEYTARGEALSRAGDICECEDAACTVTAHQRLNGSVTRCTSRVSASGYKARDTFVAFLDVDADRTDSRSFKVFCQPCFERWAARNAADLLPMSTADDDDPAWIRYRKQVDQHNADSAHNRP